MANAYACDICGSVYTGKAKRCIALPKALKEEYYVRLETFKDRGDQNIDICTKCTITMAESLLDYLKEIK